MTREIVLVNTNRLRPAVAPIGLDYTADLLAPRYHVRLLDLCFESDPAAALSRGLAGSDPLLVGLTLRNTDDCYLASGDDFVPAFSGLLAALRQLTEAPIVIGGGGYSLFPFPLLSLTAADYGLAGDGEVPLTRLAEALERGGPLDDVPGLVHRSRDGVRRSAAWTGELSELPARTRSLPDNERYFAEGGQIGVETKRGCDRRCIYCADPVGKGRRVRLRTPQQVADEFETLAARGLDHIHLCDSEFNLPAHHALAVCRELSRRGLGDRVRWYTYASPEGFTPELAQAMRAAGCVGVNFGADSGDDRILSLLGRDFTTQDLHDTIYACRAAGLVVMYDLLLGGPGETRASAARTIDLMKRLSPDRVGVSLGVRVYPDTRLAETVLAAGPLDRNPNLRGHTMDNAGFLKPIFYLSRELGGEPERYIAGLVGGDRRFFFPTPDAGAEAYNYNDNQRLVDAIQRGCRGAYWDILRRLAEE